MQLIIDIDDETYNDIKKGKIYSSFRDVPLESVNAIANGIPLDKIRTEIEQLPITDTAIKLVTEIFGKYKAESEE